MQLLREIYLSAKGLVKKIANKFNNLDCHLARWARTAKIYEGGYHWLSIPNQRK